MIRALIFLLAFAGAAAAQEQSRMMPPVEEFVTFQNYHGIQYDAAARYGPEDVAPLARVLRDDSARAAWANAIYVLGVIGTPEAVETMIDFHERGYEGTADPAALQALLFVLQALGFAANDPESPAFSYLVAALEKGERDLPWDGPGWERGTQELLLAKLSANGLGLAGNARGREVLSEMREKLTESDPERLRFLRSNIEEALETSERIEKIGYARALTPPPISYIDRRREP